MRSTIHLALTALLLFALFPTCASAKGKYVWPLTRRFGLSGTFGEYRRTRLHTGIDLRTATVTGLRVRAIGDGVIYRLSVKYRGFGKALYIRHPDGLISVYGHLEAFENRRLGLEDVVARKRKETGERYPGDIFISVPVKKGQTIGYSGETGYGFPHLHFELRRGETKPINPLSVFKQKDQTAPVIKRLILRPLGPNSLVDGQHDDVDVWLTKSSRGYRGKRKPAVSGEFVVLANVFDTVSAGNHCAAHKLELFADNQLVYAMRFDEFEYGKSSHRGGLVFDNQYAYFSPPSYVLSLHNRYGAQNPWELSSHNQGILGFSNQLGPHTLTVKAWDDAGNCSTAEIQVQSAPQPPHQDKPPVRLVERHQAKWAPLVQVWDDFAEVWLQRPENEAPSSETVQLVAKGGSGQKLTLTPLERGENWLSACLPVDGRLQGPISLSIARKADNGITWNTTDTGVYIMPKGGGVMQANGLKVEFPPDALYADQIFEVIEVPAKEVPGVPVVSGLVRKVLPEGIPLEKEVIVSFDCPSQMPEKDVARCGVYEYNAKRSNWKYRGNERFSERSVGYGVRYLSTFGLLVDKAPPQISLLEPSPGARLRSKGNRLVARITDAGSGIDYRTVVATIDGIEVDAEYDPDRKLLKGTFNLTDPRGRHRLLIKASDRAGNPAKPLDVTF